MFKRDNNAGIYLTVAFHLLLLIIFLGTRIDFMLREETSFILDFSKEELDRIDQAAAPFIAYLNAHA